MPVQWQTAHIPLSQGMQQGTDPRALEAPALEVCKNAVFDEVGGIQKRLPYSAMGGSLPSDVRRLAVYDGELVLFTKDSIYTYSSANSEWVLAAEYLAPKVTENPRFVRMPDQVECDRAELGGVVMYTWRDDGGDVYLAALDSSTGAVLAGPSSQGSDLERPRLMAMSSRIAFMAYDPIPATTVVRLKMLLPSNIDSSTLGEGISGAWQSSYNCSTGYYDIQSTSSDFGSFVVGNGTAYTVANITGGSSGSPTVNTSSKSHNAAGPMAIADIASGVSRVVVVRGTEGKADVIDWSTLSDVSMDNTVFSGAMTQVTAAWISSTSCSVFGSGSVSVAYNTISNAGTPGTQSTVGREITLASHVIIHDGAAYAWTVFDEINSVTGMSIAVGFRAALQNTYYLVRSDGYIVAKAASVRAGGEQATGHLASIGSSASGTFECAMGERRRVPLGDEASDGYAERNPLDVSITFDSDDARRLAVSGRTAYIPGGQVVQFDGESVAEVGFHAYPWDFQGVTSSGGSLSAGDYAWKATGRWQNAKGESERSTTATVAKMTASGSQKASLYVSMIKPTAKQGSLTDISIEVWRTAVNPAVGAPFYLVTSSDPTATSGANRYVENEPDSYYQSAVFDDGMSDTDLTTKQTNPENSGQLPNIAPPPCSIILAGEERVFLAGIANDPHRIWYSQLRAEGDIAAFSDFLQVSVPADGGAITALAWLQEVLVVFKERAIYTLPGDGYDNIGGGQNYGPARLVSSDVGAQTAESIGVTPDGIVFRSDKGWHILNKGFGVQYIGSNVSDYDEDTIVAVHVLESEHQVRVVSEERVLMLDTRAGQWSEWDEADSIGSVIWNGAHVLLTASTIVQQAAAHSSASDHASDHETAWVKMAGLQGFYRGRRIAVLGEYRSSCRMRVRVAYDYDNTWVDDVTWTPPSSTAGDPLQLRMRLSRQKAQAIKVRITELGPATTAPTGESFKLTGLAIEYGTKQGIQRLPAAQTQ